MIGTPGATQVLGSREVHSMMPDSLSTPCYPSNEGGKKISRARPRNSPPFSWLSPVPSLPRLLSWGTARNRPQPLTGDAAAHGTVTHAGAQWLRHSAPRRLPPLPRRRPRLLLLLLVIIRRLVVIVRPQGAVRRPPLRVHPRPAAGPPARYLEPFPLPSSPQTSWSLLARWLRGRLRCMSVCLLQRST